MSLKFATKSKKPKCVRGFPCGGSCIQKSRSCRNTLGGQAKSYAEYLGKKQAPEEDWDGYSTRLEGTAPIAGILGVSEAMDKKLLGLVSSRDQVFSINHKLTASNIDNAVSTMVKKDILREGDLAIIQDNLTKSVYQSKDSIFATGDADKYFSTVKTDDDTVRVGIIRNGKLVPLSAEDEQRMVMGQAVRDLREQQRLAVAREFELDYSYKDIQQAWNEEDKVSRQISPLEDKWLGRRPTALENNTPEYWRSRAEDWAKKQGFDDGGVNGFTAQQTKAHDIAHPISHDLTGMNSRQIHRMFGSMTDVNGRASLLAEEAVVNMVEQFSRGATVDQAMANGLRLARALSRGDSETDASRDFVRSMGFRSAMAEVAQTIYNNPNFSQYMVNVRESNRVSKTVRAFGDQFGQTATGG